jgi:glycosyltransferase involved in cell wall biosynthesis
MVPSVAKVGTDKKGFVFAGRLEASKGIGLLLENWVRLPSDFELTIVGGGPMEEELRAKYNPPNIHFKGICTPMQTLEYMSKARFLIHPSLMMETFGLTIVESMRLGVPVIAFAIGTRMELVNDGVTGFLCQPDQLLSVIQKADQYQDYEAMSKAASIFAASFDEEKIVKRQLELYQKLLIA